MNARLYPLAQLLGRIIITLGAVLLRVDASFVIGTFSYIESVRTRASLGVHTP